MTIHVVEVGGSGGVYQHTLALASRVADLGWQVTLHTSRNALGCQAANIELCRCYDWHRGVRSQLLRNLLQVKSYLRTIAHLIYETAPGSPLHLQGTFKIPLTWLAIRILSALRRRVVFSPHNTFSRDGRWTRLLDDSMRRSAVTLVYTELDHAEVQQKGGRAFYLPLLMPRYAYNEHRRDQLREIWSRGGTKRILLFAGQLRPDKRLDLLIQAASLLDDSLVAVVGEDKGSFSDCRRLAESIGIEINWNVGYVSNSEFVTSLAAADVVICPYDRASQSAVLAMALDLGIPSIASNVGGLATMATIAVPPGDVEALAAAIRDLRQLDVNSWTSSPNHPEPTETQLHQLFDVDTRRTHTRKANP